MPLLDDLLGTTRVVAPRQEEEQRRRDRLSVLAGRVAERAETDGNRTGTAKPQTAMFSDLLAGLLKPAPAPTTATGLDALLTAPSTTTGPGGGATPVGNAPVASISSIIGKRNYLTGRGDPQYRQMAQSVNASMGWDSSQFAAWDALINAESGWRPNAQNPTSTAFGFGQFLNSTWGNYGPKTSDPATQLTYMARYIKDRYGTPQKALEFHNQRNWY